MKRRLVVAALVAGLLGSIVGAVRADVTAEQVRKAIGRGANYLLEQQRNDGSWSDMIAQPGGVSALCALALSSAGVEPDDDRMQKALDYLRTIRPERTYAVALQTMVFARAEPDRDRELILRNVKWLESTQIKEGPFKGAWTYPGLGAGGDNSNSQFALLALHEAERVGVVANEQTWRLAKTYWEKCQNDDGSWGYNKKELAPHTGSMTCAGITSLVIAADKVLQSDARVSGDHIDCCAAHEPGDADRIDRAIQWLGRHYSVAYNPGTGGTWALYYLYGLERAGRLTARRFLPLQPKPGQPSRADWYREGADHLVRNQDSLSGFWTGTGYARTNPLVGTSFALLFLSKGRWPVLLAKLQHGGGDDWNRHHSDVGNLTRYVETRWKRDLTWQVIDLRLASVDDLIQTPVLYLCGSRSPLPEEPAERKELAQKLRDYLDRGGFLMAGADCGGVGFDRGFRDLMREVFPEPEYKLQLLDPEHPIWYAEEKIDPGQLRPLWGIEFGCRTSVVYAPAELPEDPRPSLSCLWELSRPGRGVKYSRGGPDPSRRRHVAGHQRAGLRHQPRTEDERGFLPPRNRAGAGRSGRARPARRGQPPPSRRLQRGAPGAGEPDGRGRPRTEKIRTHVRPELLDITDPALFDYHLVFMHGRTAFRLTDGERRQLKLYLERGGMLLADSICASRAFSESFRREMAAILPDRKLERIPVERSALEHGLWRVRPARGLAARPGNGRPRQTAFGRDPQGATRPGGDQVRRPLGRGLFALRFELRLGEAELLGVPRLHPRRCRPHRTERGAVLVAAVRSKKTAKDHHGDTEDTERESQQWEPRMNTDRHVTNVQPQNLFYPCLSAFIRGFFKIFSMCPWWSSACYSPSRPVDPRQCVVADARCVGS